MRGTLGSCHALEMPFMFGTLHHPMEQRFAGTSPEAERLSGLMMDAWIAFARNGNPSCESLGDWPTYGDSRKTMILGKDCYVDEAPYDEERRAWDLIPNRLLG